MTNQPYQIKWYKSAGAAFIAAFIITIVLLVWVLRRGC